MRGSHGRERPMKEQLRMRLHCKVEIEERALPRVCVLQNAIGLSHCVHDLHYLDCYALS